MDNWASPKSYVSAAILYRERTLAFGRGQMAFGFEV